MSHLAIEDLNFCQGISTEQENIEGGFFAFKPFFGVDFKSDFGSVFSPDGKAAAAFGAGVGVGIGDNINIIVGAGVGS
jgi:hypothetical protein